MTVISRTMNQMEAKASKKKFVWLVQAHQGEYDAYTVWPICVFSTAVKAEAFKHIIEKARDARDIVKMEKLDHFSADYMKKSRCKDIDYDIEAVDWR